MPASGVSCRGVPDQGSLPHLGVTGSVGNTGAAIQSRVWPALRINIGYQF